MPVFDQRHQKVNYQYNVNGTINFDNIQNWVDVVGVLKKVQSEVVSAGKSGAIEIEIETDLEWFIKKAVIQAQKPAPDLKIILSYLNEAKNLIADIESVTDLAKGLSEAIKTLKTQKITLQDRLHSSKQVRLTQLYKVLIERFSQGELKTLCFQLGVDYEMLDGEGKASKVRELVQYLDRHGRITELKNEVLKQRADILWSDDI